MKKAISTIILAIITLLLPGCVMDISRASGPAPESARPIVNEIIINPDAAAREIARFKEELK